MYLWDEKMRFFRKINSGFAIVFWWVKERCISSTKADELGTKSHKARSWTWSVNTKQTHRNVQNSRSKAAP